MPFLDVGPIIIIIRHIIRSDIIRSDIIRSDIIQSDTIRSDIIRSDMLAVLLLSISYSLQTNNWSYYIQCINLIISQPLSSFQNIYVHTFPLCESCSGLYCQYLAILFSKFKLDLPFCIGHWLLLNPPSYALYMVIMSRNHVN